VYARSSEKKIKNLPIVDFKIVTDTKTTEKRQIIALVEVSEK